jgi:hypothetical protein
LKRQAPFIELIVYFFRWMIIISYSENAIAGFRITEDDWGIIPDFIDGFKMAKISLNHWWGLMQKSGDVRFYRSWFFDSLK